MTCSSYGGGEGRYPKRILLRKGEGKKEKGWEKSDTYTFVFFRMRVSKSSATLDKGDPFVSNLIVETRKVEKKVSRLELVGRERGEGRRPDDVMGQRHLS